MPLTTKSLERCGVPAAIADANLPLMQAAMREFEVTTRERARMFLAQVLHESMRLTRFEEIDSGARYEGNQVLGNTQPGDGVRFKGRGPIQITGRWNYTHFGKLLGLDLVRRPEMAAVPRHGWRLAAAYFDDRGCNKAADRGDFQEVTRLINPALMHLEERRRFYELLKGADAVPGPPFLGRGDQSEGVLVATRRLSFVRTRRTGKPYLEGGSSRFDAEAEQALRSFQADHGLKVDGLLGPKTTRALTVATMREKRRRALERERGAVTTSSKGSEEAERPTRVRLPSLVATIKRLDVETDRAWERLVAYGVSRRRRVAEARAEDDVSSNDVTKILLRIEAKLGTLLEVQQEGTAGAKVASPQSSVAEAGALVAGPTAGEASTGNPERATVLQAPATLPGPPEGSAKQAASGNGAGQASPEVLARPKRLGDLSDGDLVARIEGLGRELGRAREELIRRYARAEKELAPEPPAPPRKREPRPLEAKPKPEATRPPRKERPRSATAATPDEIRTLQRRLNRFTDRRLKDVGPILVDGIKGPATRKRLVMAKYHLGYEGKEQRSAVVTPEFLQRLESPRSARLANPATLSRALGRRRKQRKSARRTARPSAGVATFDGKPVAAWMMPHLVWARREGWRGTVISGFRDPAYSEEICRQKCGAPMCPGTCAGRASNHSGKIQPGGALDVSEYVQFAQLMQRCPHSPRIFNALGPGDPNHFSATGR
ncbi:MAG: peptidoglycan-binding protein [Actinomycetota bacterium]